MFNVKSIASSLLARRLIESIRKRRNLLGMVVLGAPAVAVAGVAPPHYTLTDLI